MNFCLNCNNILDNLIFLAQNELRQETQSVENSISVLKNKFDNIFCNSHNNNHVTHKLNTNKQDNINTKKQDSSYGLLIFSLIIMALCMMIIYGLLLFECNPELFKARFAIFLYGFAS